MSHNLIFWLLRQFISAISAAVCLKTFNTSHQCRLRLIRGSQNLFCASTSSWVCFAMCALRWWFGPFCPSRLSTMNLSSSTIMIYTSSRSISKTIGIIRWCSDCPKRKITITSMDVSFIFIITRAIDNRNLIFSWIGGGRLWRHRHRISQYVGLESSYHDARLCMWKSFYFYF